jgi:hypothetical protein
MIMDIVHGPMFFIVVILLSGLWQVSSLFQREFSTQSDLVLPFSVNGILSFP